MDYDRIVVLDRGEMVEVGTVTELMERERGMLDGKSVGAGAKGKNESHLKIRACNAHSCILITPNVSSRIKSHHITAHNHSSLSHPSTISPHRQIET